MTRMKNRKAFTLIELVVVIVIIAILAAIAAFAYTTVIKNSKQSSFQQVGNQYIKSYHASLAAGSSSASAAADAAADLSNSGGSATVSGTTMTGADKFAGCTATLTLPTNTSAGSVVTATCS